MVVKDTLKQGNRIVILFYFILFYSCNLEQKENKTNLLLKKSINTIGKNDYTIVYNKANDSINSWIENKLGFYKYLNGLKKHLLDSLICFNSNRNKFIGCDLTQHLSKQSNSDGIDFFYGVKVSTDWYFFEGPHIVIPRDMYKQPTNKPLSFEKLHQIALKEVYSGYLLPNGEINENWFQNYLEGVGWCPCKTQAEYDSVYLQAVKNNWADRDTSMVLP